MLNYVLHARFRMVKHYDLGTVRCRNDYARSERRSRWEKRAETKIEQVTDRPNGSWSLETHTRRQSEIVKLESSWSERSRGKWRGKEGQSLSVLSSV